MPGKILVVEEKPFMLRLIQHHLERAGYKLIKARNQQEAIAAMSQQSPELVVMDDCGSSSKPQIPLSKSQLGVPLIRMTDVPQDLEKNAIDAEVVLTRPFSPTQLVAEVKRLVPEP
jgi:two-component system, chemotaxis family, chemotaxis protein CheY